MPTHRRAAATLDDPVLLLFSKAPRAGQVKTRLIPTLGAEGACRLHEALLADTLRLAEGVAQVCRCRVVLAWAGDVAQIPPCRRRQPHVRVLQQTGADLGERLAHAHQELFETGATAVVTLGSDSPTLPTARIEQAFARLAEVDVVIGPANDGGYVLLGTTSFQPALFHRVPWGTSRVCEITCSRAGTAGLSLHRLAAWYDVDDAAGLERLQRELRNADRAICPDTRRFLDSLRR